MYDVVRVYFADNTETVIRVHEDDDITVRIAEVMDDEGVAVRDYCIEGQVEKDE